MNNVIIGDNPALDFLNKACALFAPPTENQEMKCPFCNHDVPPMWQQCFVVTNKNGQALPDPYPEINVALPDMATKDGDLIETETTVSIRWMVCPNDKCGQVLVLVRQALHHPSYSPENSDFSAWYAIPARPLLRQIDSLVHDPYRRDYLEAALILDDSPRMSSILSRRILAELLEQFAGRTEYKLEDRIDNFIADAQFPSNLKENLHHLRDMANFSAHTKKDKATGEIIDVDHDEAEWTLEVIDGLFDYFIVRLERDKERRAKWDAKRTGVGAVRTVKTPKQ